jgi:hypothetical protein
MHTYHLSVLLVFGLMAGCATPSSTAPVEVLDERTGLTFASLKKPIELLPSAESVAFDKRSSFAYLGPVEWNRMGTISYGVWIHIAPGNDHQAADIRNPGAVTLILDDQPLRLAGLELPKLGHDPYQAVVSWGQTAYFELTVESLKKLAASQKLELDVRATDDTTLHFFPSQETRAVLTEFVRGRGITDD